MKTICITFASEAGCYFCAFPAGAREQTQRPQGQNGVSITELTLKDSFIDNTSSRWGSAIIPVHRATLTPGWHAT